MEDTKAESEIKRDERGHFLPGGPGGPGRPKGSSLVSVLNELLEQTPYGFEDKNRVILLRKMLDQAIREGDRATQKLIFNYVEGMPKQAIEHSGEITQKQFVITRDANGQSEPLPAPQEPGAGDTSQG